jgi:CHAD domain-containing protein
MDLKLPDKWIPATSAQTDLPAMAAAALEDRLNAIVRLLPIAAQRWQKDPEPIHQLRVWSRRAMAALRFYEEFLPRRRGAWMKKQVKRVRQAANGARNADILIEQFRRMRTTRLVRHCLKILREERQTAQRQVVDLEQRLMRKDRLQHRTQALVRRMQAHAPADDAEKLPEFGGWARRRLAPLVREFFKAIPRQGGERAALHRLRIRGKEVRYAMELSAGTFGNRFRTTHYEVIRQIQDRLGDINDLVMLIDFLQQRLLGEESADLPAARRLLHRAEVRLEVLIREFWEWCTARRMKQWQADWKKYLAPGPRRRRTRAATS